MFFLSPDLRVADADREAVVEFLKRHYAAGRLTDAELSARVDAAYGARHESQLRRLTRDLPALPPERRPRRPVAAGSAAAAAALVVLVVALAAVLPPEAWVVLLGVGLPLLVIAVMVIAPVALPLAAVVLLARAVVRPRRRLPVAHRLPLSR